MSLKLGASVQTSLFCSLKWLLRSFKFELKKGSIIFIIKIHPKFFGNRWKQDLLHLSARMPPPHSINLVTRSFLACKSWFHNTFQDESLANCCFYRWWFFSSWARIGRVRPRVQRGLMMFCILIKIAYTLNGRASQVDPGQPAAHQGQAQGSQQPAHTSSIWQGYWNRCRLFALLLRACNSCNSQCKVFK